MNYATLQKWLRSVMPDHLLLTVHPTTTPLYLRLQGKVEPLRYRPYLVGIEDGYATSAFGNHDEYETYDEALQAGMQHVIDYLSDGNAPRNLS